LAESEEINEDQRRVLMEIGEERSLEETPTWAVSVFCFFFLLISLIIEGSLHKLSEVLLTKYIYFSDRKCTENSNKSCVNDINKNFWL